MSTAEMDEITSKAETKNTKDMAHFMLSLLSGTAQVLERKM